MTCIDNIGLRNITRFGIEDSKRYSSLKLICWKYEKGKHEIDKAATIVIYAAVYVVEIISSRKISRKKPLKLLL